MTRLAKIVNFIAIRQFEHGTETASFRVDFTVHSHQYVSCSFYTMSICFK